ncbi:calcium binding protein 39 [Puccinia sorghi]|uniref:Calcium binding protein 39 n=1 Tax=Puccinia sorghi TaxID=27349 RepID=A0A0L6UQL1_9BASI|nr:calcium binding protein 39 [Puccinia sorghi]
MPMNAVAQKWKIILNTSEFRRNSYKIQFSPVFAEFQWRSYLSQRLNHLRNSSRLSRTRLTNSRTTPQPTSPRKLVSQSISCLTTCIIQLTNLINEDITKALQLMKSILSGSSLPTIQDSSIPTTNSNGAEDGQPMSSNGASNSSSSSSASNSSPEIVAQLAQEIYNQDLLKIFLLQMRKFEFESRKDVVNIFNLILRRQIGTRWPTVDYLANREEIIWIALKGYENSDVALNTGMILKEMLRHEILAKSLLYSDRFYDFPQYIEQTTFGIACDAMSSFKECLTRHKGMVATYLEDHYDKFFAMYTNLIQSSNYVTKRQSIKLLGEILLDRSNYNVMNQYISNEDNLKIMMNLLKDKSKNIQFEAFHVFKVFVANPRKPAPIESILKRNKEKLIEFLRKFHNDKDDEQFNDEKGFLILQIENLKYDSWGEVGGQAFYGCVSASGL